VLPTVFERDFPLLPKLRAGKQVRSRAVDSAIVDLLSEQQIDLVLMEVGANGEPPATWNNIASQSTYVGIGPWAHPSRQGLLDDFKKTYIVEKIATMTNTERVLVNVTKDAIYSSILKTHPRAITDFVVPDLTPDRELYLPASTLDAIVSGLALPGIDWLSTNINGVDVPLFKSLTEDTRRRVLAVDTHLDLVDLFVGQNSDVARYPEFVNDGFWLSRVISYGPIRMRRESLAKINALDGSIDQSYLSDYHGRTPGWLFVRFFRTVESLAERVSPPRDYLVLWAFALLDRQIGFAADLLVAYQDRFGADRLLQAMQRETLIRFKGLRRGTSLLMTAKKCLPTPFKPVLRRMWRNLQSSVRRGPIGNTRSHPPSRINSDSAGPSGGAEDGPSHLR
jgi:hypothetical protein